MDRPIFRNGEIQGVIVKPIKFYTDRRGWLAELFRHDELSPESYPVMAYISETLPGVARGPHEHRHQSDYFAFLGPGDFKLYIWDTRQDSPTFGCHSQLIVGESNPVCVQIPPGVVHAYKNISNKPGIVFNAPNKLYAGWGKREPVDEIRYEDIPDSPFQLD